MRLFGGQYRVIAVVSVALALLGRQTSTAAVTAPATPAAKVAASNEPTVPVDNGVAANAALGPLLKARTNSTNICGKKTGDDKKECSAFYQGQVAEYEKLYEIQALISIDARCVFTDFDARVKRPDKKVVGNPNQALDTCPYATGFSNIAVPVHIQTQEEVAATKATVDGSTKPTEPGLDTAPNTIAIAYFDLSGSPINLSAYDWRACNAAASTGGASAGDANADGGNSVGATSGSATAGGAATGGKSAGKSAKPGANWAWLQTLISNIQFGSDEYSLAYQSSCNTNSSVAVPNDPIYQNSGIVASSTFNSFTTTKTASGVKIEGSGSGKMVGAIGLDVIPVARQIPGASSLISDISNSLKTPLGGAQFCENCHLFPYIGLDYEFTQKATGPGRVGLSNAISVKQIYYGVAFNNTLVLDPIFNWLSRKSDTNPGYTCPGDKDFVFATNQPDIDPSNGSPNIYAPGQRDGTNGEEAPTFDRYWPAPVGKADCRDFDAQKMGGARAQTSGAQAHLPAQGDYYVWEDIKTRPAFYLNVTGDIFVLKDELNDSKIAAFNTRLVPFAIFSSQRGDFSIGLNEYNRPPIYLSGLNADHMINDPTDGDEGCKAGNFCGFDWDPNDDRIALVFDVRIDAGHFVQRGLLSATSDPALTEDYVRLGSRAGAVIEINLLKNNPIALQATYLDYVPFEGFRGNLGLIQLEADYVLTNFKGLTLALSYENGRNQDTAERVEDWTLSLKYAPGK